MAPPPPQPLECGVSCPSGSSERLDVVSASVTDMAGSSGILPLYTRQSSAYLLRRVFRSKARVIVTLVCIPLVFLTVGLVTTLSIRGHGGAQEEDLLGGIHHQQGSPELSPQPPPPPLAIGDEGTFRKEDGVYRAVVNRSASHIAKDREKLLEKVKDEHHDVLPGNKQVEDRPRMVTQGGEDADPVARKRRDKIKEMILHGWNGYRNYSWGENELRPISKRGHTFGLFGAQSMGVTIIDTLDTLYIAGLMDEFNEAVKWVKQKLDFSRLRSDVSVFEINIRFVGGLLSAYSLTGDPVFLEKAKQIANKLLPAFVSASGIPYGVVNTATRSAKNHRWASGGSSILSEFGTLHLEFAYLSDVTGSQVYRNKVERIRDVVQRIHKKGDLYPNYLNPNTGTWGERHTSLGAFGDSFYEYLLKSYVQSNYKDEVAKEMYEEAVNVITKRLVVENQAGLTYIAEASSGSLMHKMDHLACFASGMYALGASKLKYEGWERDLNIAGGIANTCHESYARSPTGLGPDSFRISGAAILPNSKQYNLRPEAVEAYFYLWRITKNQKYREWAWEAAMAIDKHCRSDAGYSGLRDVYKTNPVKDDVQQSFLLAETFKYLYLIFSDDSLMSLDEWVFNTEAHPIPIAEVNTLYRKAEAVVTTAPRSSNENLV